MFIKFNKITVNNFFSYSHSELELNDLGYTVVSGINSNKSDAAASNGSGKSTIFNAICYALTGETAQGLKNNVENIYADPQDCWVELDFNVDNDNFVVRRIKTPNSNMKIYLNGADVSGKGIKESTAILAEYLPDLNSMLLGSIIILGQGLPYRFTNNVPAGRKELLEKLTKSDFMVQSVREMLDARQIVLRSDLREHEDKRVANNTQLELFNKQVEAYEEEMKEYEKYQSSETNIDSRLVEIKKKINKCLGLVGKLSTDKLNLEKDVAKIETDKDEFIKTYQTKNNEQLINIDNSIKRNTEFASDNKANIKSLKAEIKRLEAITDICPTCGQKIPNVKKIDTSDLKKKLSDEEEMLSLHNDKLKDLENQKKELQANLTKEFDENLSNFNENISKLREELKDIETSIANNNSEYQNAMKDELKFNNLKENYTKLVSNIETTKKLISDVTSSNEEVAKLITEDNERLSVIQSLITLTKKEFRGVLLENIIKYINNKVKQYSKQVFGNELLSFTLNENYIDVMFDNKYYEALSGGEKQKVDIIIQLALRDLLSSNLGIKSNILVLDEIFDNLDSAGCQAIMKLISNIKDIESVFIISHHTSDLQISYDTEIIVEKNQQGISTINVH